MKTMLKRLWKEEEGQDLIEYALLVALIALVAVTIFPTVGASINTIFTDANTCLTGGACAGPAAGGGGTIIFGL